MADLDGFSATRRLVADEATKNIPGDRRHGERVRQHAAGGERGRLRRVPAEAGSRRSVVRRAADASRRRSSSGKQMTSSRRTDVRSNRRRVTRRWRRACAKRSRSARSPICTRSPARSRFGDDARCGARPAHRARWPRALISTAFANWPRRSRQRRDPVMRGDGTVGTPPSTILVVDDSATNLQVLVRTLQRQRSSHPCGEGRPDRARHREARRSRT